MRRSNRHFFYLTNSFSEQSGGRTQSIFNRAKLLTDQADKSFILSFNFKRNYGDIVDYVITNREIPASVEFLNIYEFFAGEKIYFTSQDQPIITFDKQANLDYEYIEEKNAYKVFDGKFQINYVQLDSNGSVRYCDYFDQQKRKLKRDLYDLSNNIIRIQYFDLKTKNVIRSNFYTREGRLYLSIESDRATGDTKQCISYDKKQNTNHKFANEDEMNKFWIGTLNEQYDNSIFFSEYRWLDHTLIDNRYTNRKIISIAQIHSRHLDSPFTFGSKLRTYNGLALKNMSDYSAVVVLTKQQYTHVVNQFGNYPNLYKISHHATKKKINRLKRKDYNKIVVISRFVKLKRVMDILEAFKIAHAELPQLQLELWGKGEEEEAYRTFIIDNNLSDVVKIKGYTNNPNEVFYSGGISIMTSKFEGFGMTILESMSNTTPVIAYDFNYGPRELIDNNENGFIVEDGNIKELAEKIICLQKDRKLLKRFSKKAGQKIEEFQPKVIKQQWLEVIDNVERNRSSDNVPQHQAVLLSELKSLIKENDGSMIRLQFKIENTLSSGTPNEKYFLYLRNYFNLDEIGDKFIELNRTKVSEYKEVLEGVFTVNQTVYEELSKMKLNLRLDVHNGNEYYYVGVQFNGDINK